MFLSQRYLRRIFPNQKRGIKILPFSKEVPLGHADLRPTPDGLVKYSGDDAKKLVPTGDYAVEVSNGDIHARRTFYASVAQGIEARTADDE